MVRRGYHPVRAIASMALMAPMAFTVNAEVGGEHTQFALEEVVVTARKRNESLLETPVSVTAFSGSELEVMQMDSVDQISASTPNLVFQKSAQSGGISSAGIMFIRGIGQTDFAPTTEPGVGLYIDGVYMSQASASTFNLVDIESIQVLRGPQGTLFGRNTIGGAILVNTKKPDEEFRGSVQALVGSRDRKGVKASVNVPLTDTLFAGVSFMSEDQDGYISRPFLSGKSGDSDGVAGRLALRWQPSDDLDINLSVDYAESEDHGIPATIGEPVGVLEPNNPGSFVWLHNNLIDTAGTNQYTQALVDTGRYTSLATEESYSELRSWGTNLTVDWDFENFALKSISSYREVDASGGWDDDHSPVLIRHLFDDLDSEEWSQEFQISGVSMDDRLDWVAGVYYAEVEAFNPNVVQFVPVHIQSGAAIDNNSKAVFAQATYSLTDALDVTLGARYSEEEKVSTVDDRIQYRLWHFVPAVPTGPDFKLIPNGAYKADYEEFDPHLNVSYQWNEDLMTYVSYSEGFKGGGWVQRTGDTYDTLPGFEPETTKAYEIGFKLSAFDERVRLSGAVFLTDYDDVQVTVRVPGANAPITANAGEGTIQGGELESTMLLTERLKLIVGIAYLDFDWDKLDSAATDAGVEKSDNLPFASDWQTNASFEYTLPLADGELISRVDWSYRTEHYFDGANNPDKLQDGYSLINAGITYVHGSGDWEIALVGKNLVDEYYKVNGAAELANHGYSSSTIGTPREWALKAKYLF